MLNDKKAIELLSKSLQGRLSTDEAAAVDEHLKNNEESRAYAKLSEVIQSSVAELGSLAERGDASAGPGLSNEAKIRLGDSVNKAIEQNLSESKLAPTLGGFADETRERAPSERSSLTENQPGDQRELNSRFAMIRQLGQGGLGNVWLARDEKLNRNVAIKEMNQHALQSPKAWQRFDREAEITGHLEHPNVVPLYQYGTDSKSGEPFYAMRFVGKRTLADAIEEYHDRCQEGGCDPLILHRLLTAFLDVCQAIAYAHSRGVIHRDLKPENVALDNFGQVIVLDWGLAKIADDGELGGQISGEHDLSDEALAKTMDGEVIGTPLYMSPEQAAGGTVCHKTDIYGLGAILFSILSGAAPHENSHSGSGGKLVVQDVLKAIRENATPSPRDYRDDVPLELEAICQKAMSRKKYARHESASELATEVERWMVDQGRRQAEYENMRMEGRELRANVQAAVRDLETNVRFMSNLPPIQELIHVQADEDTSAWRDRLVTIFSGLLKAKSDYRSIVYNRIEGDQFTELVRVERHSTVHSNIRAIPRSRLRSGTISDFTQNVVQMNPDEVHTSLACNPLCDATMPSAKDVSLVAGVPVFDETSEELFGVVMIECDLERVMKDQLNRRFTAADIVIACDTFHVMMHNNTAEGLVDETVGQPIAKVLPKFDGAVEGLQTSMEYIDETNRQIYGARLWLIPKKHGIMFLLSQK
jgi:serine/threonine protein kinase